MTIIDIAGNTYGRLTVIKDSGRRTKPYGEVLWLCQCVCKNFIVVRGNSLRSGNTKSCGCLSSEWGRKLGARNKAKLITHGRYVGARKKYVGTGELK